MGLRFIFAWGLRQGSQATGVDFVEIFKPLDLTECGESHSAFQFTQAGLGDSDHLAYFPHGESACYPQTSQLLTKFIHFLLSSSDCFKY
jgi:hypothetical protein